MLRIPPEDGTTAELAIAVRHVDASEDRIVTTPRKFTQAFHEFVNPSDFSPDGDAVLAASDYFSPHFTLALFPIVAAPTAERSARVVVSDPDYNLWQGKYSPNGKWIAFAAQSRKQARTTTIEVVPASGGDWSSWVHVTASGLTDKPRWSVDGKRLYFIVMQHGFFNVWAVPFDPVRGRVAGPAYQVTHFDSQDYTVDGSWLARASSVLRFPVPADDGADGQHLDARRRRSIEADPNRPGETRPDPARPGPTDGIEPGPANRI